MMVLWAAVRRCGAAATRGLVRAAMRILVVEDEHRLATVLTQGLTEQGYAVDLA